MAVSFIAAGAIADDLTGAASFTPTPPTHLADDILIAAAWGEGANSDKPVTATSGWAEIATVNGGVNGSDATWWWKRATGAGTAGPTITSATTDTFGIVAVYRGCVTTGTPFVDATTSGDADTTDTTPDTALITTTNINQMVVAILCHGDDIAFTSGNPPALWTNDATVLTGDGTDAGFTFMSRTLASAGDAAAVSFGTWAAGEEYAALTLALIPKPTAAITGTITASIVEGDIVTGLKTLIITLTDDNWIAAGAGSFDLQRDEIIAGCTSAQGETFGWNLVPKALQSLGGVVRTSNTVVTITWDAQATYDITATETITVTIPGTATVGAVAIVATPTFTITPTVQESPELYGKPFGLGGHRQMTQLLGR
jgi:hypothetical protein